MNVNTITTVVLLLLVNATVGISLTSEDGSLQSDDDASMPALESPDDGSSASYVKSDATPQPIASLVNPTSNIIVAQYSVFNVTANVSCLNADCGNTRVKFENLNSNLASAGMVIYGKYEPADHGLDFSTYISGSPNISMIDYEKICYSSEWCPISMPSSFYKKSEGLNWTHGSPSIYDKDSFVTHVPPNRLHRSDVSPLNEATYNNIHNRFDDTPFLEHLENPDHNLSENIIVDWQSFRWYEDGLDSRDGEALTLKIPSKSVMYRLDTQCIPMERITDRHNNTIDFEWRGKMLLFGEEYYVTNIQGDDKVHIAKGKVLDGVTSYNYGSEYLGYTFKIDHLLYNPYSQVTGIVLNVKKPDSTIVQTQITRLVNGIVDDIEIAGVYAEEADYVAVARIIVYDTTTNVLLEDNKDIEIGGEVKKYWKVSLGYGNVSDNDGITEYDGMTGDCLDNVTIEYRHSIELAEGESLQFPSNFILTFNGYRTADRQTSPCSGEGEGDIILEKDGNYKLMLSFTDTDGRRHNDVGLHQGPYSEGDTFLLGGDVYEYETAGRKGNAGACDTMEVYLKNLLTGIEDRLEANAYTQRNFTLRAYSFEESAVNDVEILIQPNESCNDTQVFLMQDVEGLTGVGMLYDNGSIYFVRSSGGELADGQYIGVWGGDQGMPAFGPVGGAFDDFENNGNNLALYILTESSNDSNYDGNADDTLIILNNSQGEYAVIDLYDREYNSTAGWTEYYKMRVSATGSNNWNDSYGIPNSDYVSAVLNDEDDILLMLPDGGDRLTLSYGLNRNINSVSICHPKDRVYGTAFIGTGEQNGNPQYVELDVGGSQMVVFSMYASGAVNSNSEFYILANLKGNTLISNQTKHLNLTIIEEGIYYSSSSSSTSSSSSSYLSSPSGQSSSISSSSISSLFSSPSGQSSSSSSSSKISGISSRASSEESSEISSEISTSSSRGSSTSSSSSSTSSSSSSYLSSPSGQSSSSNTSSSSSSCLSSPSVQSSSSSRSSSISSHVSSESSVESSEDSSIVSRSSSSSTSSSSSSIASIPNSSSMLSSSSSSSSRCSSRVSSSSSRASSSSSKKSFATSSKASSSSSRASYTLISSSSRVSSRASSSSSKASFAAVKSSSKASSSSSRMSSSSSRKSFATSSKASSSSSRASFSDIQSSSRLSSSSSKRSSSIASIASSSSSRACSSSSRIASTSSSRISSSSSSSSSYSTLFDDVSSARSFIASSAVSSMMSSIESTSSSDLSSSSSSSSIYASTSSSDLSSSSSSSSIHASTSSSDLSSSSSSSSIYASTSSSAISSSSSSSSSYGTQFDDVSSARSFIASSAVSSMMSSIESTSSSA